MGHVFQCKICLPSFKEQLGDRSSLQRSFKFTIALNQINQNNMKILRRDVRVRESISISRGAERCKNGREQKSKSRDLESSG